MSRPVRRPCGYCDGAGYLRGKRFEPDLDCPVCEGVSQVRVPPEYVRCQTCLGRGRYLADVPGRQNVVCDRCNGTGWAPQPLRGD